METEITLSLIGLATTVATGIISYKTGRGSRRKENAEASAMEYESLNKVREFYASTLDAINARMEELSDHEKESRRKKYTMRSIIDYLSGIACKDNSCRKRVPLSQEEIDIITNESSIIDFKNHKEDHKNGTTGKEDLPRS